MANDIKEFKQKSSAVCLSLHSVCLSYEYQPTLFLLLIWEADGVRFNRRLHVLLAWKRLELGPNSFKKKKAYCACTCLLKDLTGN